MEEKRRCWPTGYLLLALSLFSGCASKVPQAIRVDVASPVPMHEVWASPKRFINMPVRWGGEIISIQNKERETWVEVLARPLGSDGRPKKGAIVEGRFLARTPGFLDPAVFAPGRELTVAGRLESLVIQNVGDFPYRFPLLEIKAYYLWPSAREYPDPWHDPFYDPWYPYYWDPYYRYPYYRNPWW